MNYSNKIYKKLFDDEPELEFVEVEEDDRVFPIGEFLQDCIEGCFIDYDGWGYFVKTINGTKYAIKDIGFSIDDDMVYYKGEYVCPIFEFCCTFCICEVVWFNR